MWKIFEPKVLHHVDDNQYRINWIYFQSLFNEFHYDCFNFICVFQWTLNTYQQHEQTTHANTYNPIIDMDWWWLGNEMVFWWLKWGDVLLIKLTWGHVLVINWCPGCWNLKRMGRNLNWMMWTQTNEPKQNEPKQMNPNKWIDSKNEPKQTWNLTNEPVNFDVQEDLMQSSWKNPAMGQFVS